MALTAITRDFIIQQGAVINGTQAVTSSTNQSSALQVNSGAAISQNLIVGTTADIYGAVSLHDALTVTGATQLSSLGVSGAVTFSSNVSVGGAFSVTSATTLSSTLAVTGATSLTGALTANAATFNGNLSVSGSNTLTVGSGATSLGGTLAVTGDTTLSSTTAATSAGAGALKVTGGAYVGGNLFVNDTTNSTATGIGSIVTKGGVGIAKDLNVGGNTVIGGNLTVLGVQTVFNSTSTSVTDPVIDLGTAPNGEELTTDDGYNKGLIIHYYDTVNSTAKHMFFGRSDSGASNGRFVVRNGITSKDNADLVNSGAYAGMDIGSMIVHDTTDASGATGTGALQVNGGASITSSLYVGTDFSAATVKARNLTAGRVSFAGTGGQLTDDASLTYNSTTGILTGTITQAQHATSLSGGSTNAVPYQTAAGTTAFISQGNHTDLFSVDAFGVPYWRAQSDLVVGYATTASNIMGGGNGEIPFNPSAGVTSFDSGLTYAGSLLTAPTISVSSITDATNSTSGALKVAGGVGIAKNLYVGQSVNIAGDLNVDGTIYLKGVGLDTITSTTGTFVNVHINGSGTSLVVDNNATITGTATVGVLNATSGAITNNLQAGTLTVSGTANLQTTNVSSLTSTGTVTANALTVNNNATVGGTFGVTGATTLTGAVTAQAGLTVSSGLTSVGVLTAGATTATSLNVTGSSRLADVSATSLTVSSGLTSVAALTAGVTTATSMNVTGNAHIGGSLTVDGGITFSAPVDFTDTTDAINNASTGSVVVSGGVGIAKSLSVGGPIYAGLTNAATTGTAVYGLYINDTVLASYTSPVITGSSKQDLDHFNASKYRGARYTIQVVDGSNVEMTDMMIVHDGSNVYLNQFGTIYSNTQLGIFDANLTGGVVTMTFTPAAATSMVIKVVRMTITA